MIDSDFKHLIRKVGLDEEVEHYASHTEAVQSFQWVEI